MDTFYEQIVSKQNTGLDVLKKVGVLLAMVVLSFAFLFVLPSFSNIIGTIFSTIGLFLVVGVLYGGWYLLIMMNVEYEYILTNGEIDIDKIMAKRKRKRLITVNVRNFTEMGKYDAEQLKGQTFNSTIMASGNPMADDTLYAVVDHAKHGKCLLVFSPNEHLRDGMRQYVKRTVWKELV